MCGICGYLWTSRDAGIKKAEFDRMTDSLAHRGPDDRGTFFAPPADLKEEGAAGGPGVALGHRRLSILDLSEAGRQPMAESPESYPAKVPTGGHHACQIVFNGEIYNFIELREKLTRKGYRFRTQTDTEVILALYREHGSGFTKYLNGMFAIALWDPNQRTLILARDRLGKKPLYYRREPERIVFASELNTLMLAPRMPRELDPIALDQYLTYQYVPQPRTIYRGISKLPPATLAVWRPGLTSVEAGEWHTENYWNVDFNLEENRSEGEWTDLVRCTLEDAVRIRLRSDVPLGAFLSGGIDSTIIVGLMKKLGTGPVQTFSVGFSHREYDETPVARRTAARLGTEHHEIFATPDAEEIFPLIAPQYGEPFGDSSAIPSWMICQAIRKEVTVALSGDGGDELFAGYDRYKAVGLGKFFDCAPVFLRRLLAGPVRGMIPASTRQRSLPRRAKRFLEALGMPPAERYLQWTAIFNQERLALLASPRFKEELVSASRTGETEYDRLGILSDAMGRCTHRNLVTATSLADVLTYLPGDILAKVDIASMRHALEVRSPILDYRVAELAFKIPIGLKIQGRKGKAILRKAFREYLPPELDNRPKTGFGVPLDHWFRGPLRQKARDILTDRNNPVAGYFNPDYVDRLLEEHSNGVFDHAARIWALMILFHWARHAL